MKGVQLLLVALTTLLSFSHAYKIPPLVLTGNGYEKTPEYLFTEAEYLDYYASPFRSLKNTVVWFNTTIICPFAPTNGRWCSWSFYFRELGDNTTHILAYSPYQCTKTQEMKHNIMLIMNDRNESYIFYRPLYQIMHNCEGGDGFRKQDQILQEVQTGTFNENVKITLLKHDDPSKTRPKPLDYPLQMEEHTWAHWKQWIKNKNGYTTENAWLERSPTVFSVLRPTSNPEEFNQCRAFDDFDTIFCSDTIFGKNYQGNESYYLNPEYYKNVTFDRPEVPSVVECTCN